MTPRFQVNRWFWQTPAASAPGTFFALWGGFASADHVLKAQQGHYPDYVAGELTEFGGLVDAVLFGCDIPTFRPPDPIEGQRVTVYGYPRGSDQLTHRVGTVYINRGESGSPGYEYPTWIVRFDEKPIPVVNDVTTEPVTTGMSGGPVTDWNGGPLGILVTEGHAMDSDRDGIPENTCDFVSLSSVWDAAHDLGLVS